MQKWSSALAILISLVAVSLAEAEEFSLFQRAKFLIQMKLGSSFQLAALDAAKQTKTQHPRVRLAVANALDDPDRAIRIQAMETLHELFPQDTEVTLALVEKLKDGDFYVAYDAEKVLAQKRSKDPFLLSALLELLVESDGGVGLRAGGTLVSIGTPEVHSALYPLLLHQDSQVQLKAAKVLNGLKSTEPLLATTLTRLLQDSTPSVRKDAAEHLGNLNSPDLSVFTELALALNDPDWGVRFHAIYALKQLRPRDPWILEQLVETFQDEQALNRAYAIQAVAAIGAKSNLHPQVIEAIEQMRDDPDEKVRVEAIVALAHLKPWQLAEFREFIRMLLGTEDSPREFARAALGRVNWDAYWVFMALAVDGKEPNGIQEIMKSLGHARPEVRALSALALKRHGITIPRDRLTLLGNAIYSLDFVELGERDRQLIAEIEEQLVQLQMEHLHDTDSSVRRRAVNNLIEMKPRFELALNQIRREIKNPDPEVRERIEMILTQAVPARIPPTATQRILSHCKQLLGG